MSGVPHFPNEAQLLAEFGFVRRLALSLVRDPHLADDLAQQTFVVALEGRTAPRGPMRAWLAGIVKNLARMSWRSGERRVRRETVAAKPEPVPSAAEDAARLEAQEHLVRAVRGLPEPMRATVVLRYLEDESLPTIAERMNISVRAVESRLRRARAQLREKLTEAYGDRKAWLPSLCVIAGLKPPTTGLAVGAAGTGVLLMSVKLKLALVALVLLVVSAVSVQTLWPVAADSEPPAPIGSEEVPVADVRAGSGEPGEILTSAEGQPAAARAGKTAPRPPMPRNAKLRGVVRSADGSAVPGATLSIRGTEVKTLRVGVVTDGNGRFEVSRLPAVRVSVVCFPRGALFVERFVDLADGWNELNMDLPPWEELTVLVVDHVNRPIEGARIQMFQKSGNWTNGKTAADGLAHFRLQFGFRDLYALVDDPARRDLYMPAAVSERPKDGRLRVQLREADHVAGSVLDAEGKPVSRAFIDVLMGEEQVAYGISDADGKFRLPYPKGATVTLVARGSQAGVRTNHVDLLARGRVAGVGSGSGDVVLKMVPVARDRTLTCEVRGPRGEPMPGAKVCVRSALVMSKIQEGTADSNGLVRFHDLPAIDVRLLTWSYERTGEELEWSVPRRKDLLPKGQTVVLEFRLSKVTTGVLTDREGKPVKRCRVELKRVTAEGEKALAQVWTDEKGRFLARTPADEPGPLTLVTQWKAKDGAKSSIRLPGVKPGERDLEISFGR